ncbi:phosphatase PAP2 family protein [Azotobacter beijerinckii]|uniref:Membrane-associated enzyme, PAP2 (Acid phosphatase) superfamily n=1 Tax=Azotobacter beijerinckii TaxID=170623 RepID=A0A1I4ATR7_9GAMM|nr:Membrane-associated enzyme, PAP2 (acid phosphatase) superfamily [Azotobacter beijerinckii]SFK59865.1 Membrane-associated enzyme, PAP2 (acid phosphatase) superfamily [Azotobacter beijerinckii]
MSATELSLPAVAAAGPLPALSQPFDFRLALGIPLAAMAFLLLFDPSSLDFAISRWFYAPGEGFIGRHYGSFLENFLHDRAKQAVIVVGVLAIAGFLLSLLPTVFRRWRRVLGYVVLAMGLSTSLVNPLKTLTGMHCPWSLKEFGGREVHTALLEERAPPVVRAGRCWPGGHASAGFSLLALFFALRDRRPRLARIALWTALGLGAAFSVGRVMQGAHFLSHNLWTLLLDWTICTLGYRLILYRPEASAPA